MKFNNSNIKNKTDGICLTEQIPGGEIRVYIERTDMPHEDLFTFAARNNSKRAFLFLSNVLGKHLPVTPKKIQDVHERIANKIPSLPGPVLFIGMAETATCLGQGVFEAWLSNNPNHEALYLHTTRYRVQNAELIEFEESHSHAPHVFLHRPTTHYHTMLFEQAKSIVLIDDEISTGNTFSNLIRACRNFINNIERVHISVITDFMGTNRRAELTNELGLPVTTGAIMEGAWTFTSNNYEQEATPAAQAERGSEVVVIDGGFGRMGRSSPLEISPSFVRSLACKIIPGSKTLVLGTGEFMHAGYILGRALAAETGEDVLVHATTRSPIIVWGPIHHVESFKDNYNEGVLNYLYNLERDQYGKIFICHETAPCQSLFQLAKKLNASLVHFHRENVIAENPIC